MATGKIEQVFVGDIALLPTFNGSRGADPSKWFSGPNDENTVIMMLVAEGWKSKDGLAIVTPIKPERVDQAMQLRKAYFANLEKDTTEYIRDVPVGTTAGSDSKRKVRYTAANIEKVANALFKDKNGELLVPRYEAVCAYRRLTSWPEAMVVRHMCGLDVIEEIAVEVKTYKSDLERFVDCIEENEKKLEGTLATTGRQKWIAVKDHIFDLGGSEADAARAVKRGMAQVIWAGLRVDQKFPELGLMESIRDDSYKNLSKCRADKLRALLNDGCDAEEVSNYLAHPDSKNATKSMKREGIKGMAERCPNPVIRCSAKAILEDDPTYTAPLLDATIVNGVPFKDTLRQAMIDAIVGVFNDADREAEGIEWLKRASA